MIRRSLIAGILATLSGLCRPRDTQARELQVLGGPPEKIRLIPDMWDIRNVGRLNDGRLFWVDAQLDTIGGPTRDFVCTFLFDADGHLANHSIELIGTRGSYPDGGVSTALQRHLDALGKRTRTDIWVRPFSVESQGSVFGLIPRQTNAGDWRVEFMPGNTLSFFPPWEAGEYDT
jgi:hypothetical protein